MVEPLAVVGRAARAGITGLEIGFSAKNANGSSQSQRWARSSDTSVFIAEESERPIPRHRTPDEVAVSVVTIGELRVGVLAASDEWSAALLDCTHSSAANWSEVAQQVLAAGGDWGLVRALLLSYGLLIEPVVAIAL